MKLVTLYECMKNHVHSDACECMFREAYQLVCSNTAVSSILVHKSRVWLFLVYLWGKNVGSYACMCKHNGIKHSLDRTRGHPWSSFYELAVVTRAWSVHGQGLGHCWFQAWPALVLGLGQYLYQAWLLLVLQLGQHCNQVLVSTFGGLASSDTRLGQHWSQAWPALVLGLDQCWCFAWLALLFGLGQHLDQGLASTESRLASVGTKT